MNKFLAVLLCAVLAVSLFGETVCADASVDTADRLIDGVLTYKAGGADHEHVQAWLDGALCEGAGGTEWYVLALSQSGEDYDFSSYLEALSDHLSQNVPKNAVTRQKYALSFLAAGEKNEFTDTVTADSIGKLGVMSIIFGLHLTKNGLATAEYTEASVTEMLLSRQLAGGGFSLSGENADADVTAMAVQALAYRAETAEVKLAMENAVSCLSSLRREDGHYANYGNVNAESTAQVIIALASVGIDVLTDARFTQNGVTLLDTLLEFRLENGAFSHTLGGEADENATAQALLALLSLKRQAEGKAPLFDLDRAETAVYRASSAEKSSERNVSVRMIAVAALVILALIVCAILFLTGKRHPKNFLATAIVLVLAILAALFIRIERPEDYYGGETQKGEIVGEVTLSIRCDAVAGKADHLPADGVILSETVFAIDADDTVYDILTEAARTHKLSMDKEGADGLYYVSGIAYLYEFDFGDLSGWVYKVNGEKASVGCDAYTLSDGDVIVWEYTLTVGK